MGGASVAPDLRPGPCASPGCGLPAAAHLDPLPAGAIVPFHYGDHTHNISEAALRVFSFSIYSGEAEGFAVPVVELIAHAVLVISLIFVLIRIAIRRRTQKLLVSDSWLPVPTADMAVRVFTGLAALALLVTTLELGLMFVRMHHNGAFVAIVFALHGVLDNIPWVCCLHHCPPGRAAIGRSILLLVALTSLRVLAVVGQPPIEEYLFSFAPTALAMRLNNLTGSGCLLLFFLTFLYDPSATPSDPNDPSGSTRSELSASALAVGRSRCVPRLRAEARPWLLFLCISYWGVSLGYTLYAWAGLSPVAAMWIQEGFLYLYAALFAPCLLLTFKREQRYWRAHALAPHSAAALAASYAMAAHGSPQHAERLLGASPPPHSRTEAGRAPQQPQHTASASSRFAAAKRAIMGRSDEGGEPSAAPGSVAPLASPSPSVRAPPGAAWSTNAEGARMLRTALAGVRIVPADELCVQELIGVGGFADVFRATWHSAPARRGGAIPMLSGAGERSGARGGVEDGSEKGGSAAGVEVAVKALKQMPRQADGLGAFCKEIRLMQRLCHPNVIPLLGVSIAPHGGQLSVITELMPRGSVFQLLHPMGGGRPGVSGVPLPRVLAMRMLGDCARGMGYLHSMSPPIIHRDLKSQNLLVASDYSVRVADFGLSRECLQAGAMTRVGSVQWAAPEVLLGKEYSHLCDLWSFGVVCWEVLTARVPFDGMAQTLVATKVAVEGLRLPVPPRTPLRLLRLMARCWSENPSLRPSFDEVEIECQGLEHTLMAEGETAVPAQGQAATSSSAP